MKTLLDIIMFCFLGLAAIGTIFVLVLFFIWATSFVYEVVTGRKTKMIRRLLRMLQEEI